MNLLIDLKKSINKSLFFVGMNTIILSYGLFILTNTNNNEYIDILNLFGSSCLIVNYALNKDIINYGYSFIWFIISFHSLHKKYM